MKTKQFIKQGAFWALAAMIIIACGEPQKVDQRTSIPDELYNKDMSADGSELHSFEVKGTIESIGAPVASRSGINQFIYLTAVENVDIGRLKSLPVVFCTSKCADLPIATIDDGSLKIGNRVTVVGTAVTKRRTSKVITKIYNVSSISDAIDLSPSPTVLPTPTPTPIINPTNISFSDFTYSGAFRLPEVSGQGSTFTYITEIAAGGAVMTFNSTGDGGNGSLLIRGHVYQMLVAEINIPTPSKSSLPAASVLQPFGDVAGSFLSGAVNTLSGLLVTTPAGQSSPRLFWTVRPYYNTSSDDLNSHGVSSLNLNSPQAIGIWNIANYPNNSTAGYLGEISAWFADTYLGGKRIITGQAGVSGNASSSWGPAAFAIKPWLDNGSFPTNGTDLANVPLVFYPLDKRYPGWKGANKVNAAQWIQVGSKQGLVFSVSVGLGADEYGDGSAFGDQLDNTKGYHAYPYQTQLWFYSIDDIQKVAQGTMQPWDIRPYEQANINSYLLSGMERLAGPIAFDSVNKRLFFLEANGSSNGYDPIPVVHVFQAN